MTEKHPSIGIEIELPWKVMLARVDPSAADILSRRRSFWATEGVERSIVQDALDQLDAEYKPRIAAAHMAGIGKGLDGYAEFAHTPKRAVEPLLDEVSYLYDADLLRPGEIYPLHVTLGGYALDRAAGQMLFGLEVVGGTRPERILQTRSWNRKGKAGVLNRQPHELSLGYREGVEYRTLELYSLGQLTNILKTALSGAQAIMGNTEWTRWREVLEERARLKDIDITRPWPAIDEDEMQWLNYASALNDGEWVIDSSAEIMALVD